MKVISVINQKGGVGKTTTALNIGAGLSEMGHKVLMVDMDSQAHLTISAGIDSAAVDSTVYDVLKGDRTISDVMVNIDKFKLVPSNIQLSKASLTFSGELDWQFLLSDAFKKDPNVNSFDYVLIDCPPSLGVLTINALVASDKLIIPVEVEYLALEGVSQLIKTIKQIQARLNPRLRIGGVLATKFDQRNRSHREIKDMIHKYFDDMMYETVIRRNVKLSETPSYGKSIFEYAPDSYGAIDYQDLCLEIDDREESYYA